MPGCQQRKIMCYSDDESYDMLDDHSLAIKQEDIDSDNYSIYSNDDRKLPAQSATNAGKYHNKTRI